MESEIFQNKQDPWLINWRIRCYILKYRISKLCVKDLNYPRWKGNQNYETRWVNYSMIEFLHRFVRMQYYITELFEKLK